VQQFKQRISSPIPARAGIGLRAQHYMDVIEQQPDIGWFEVHSENYFGDGGKPHYYLEQIRANYPLSLHGVGLSIGACEPLNQKHLSDLKSLIQRYEPGLVSEHLSWGVADGRYLNDLLPLPYTVESLSHMVNRLNHVQDILQQSILIENVSSYLEFSHSTITEWDFLVELAQRSGCGILLDVNNIYVSAFNHSFDALEYLNAIPESTVREIHLAGHTRKMLENTEILIDSHNQHICDDVWKLYHEAVRLFPKCPVLIEWDSDVPTLDVLLSEAQKADNILRQTA